MHIAWEQMILSCKHKFLRQRSNISIENLYFFKGYGAKKLVQEFPNKAWGLRGMNKLLKKQRKKLVQWQDKAAAFDHELCERTTLTLSYFYIMVHKLDIIRKEHIV